MKSASVLIVEDEQITAADIEDILANLGHFVVKSVSNGERSVYTAGLYQPDLVLMDIRIQGEIDGIEAAKTIRERFDIPTIFLTAHADDATLDRAKAAEPLGYILKPFHESELQAAIQMALHKRGLDRERKQHEQALETTLDSLEEGVIRIDAAGRVFYLNPEAERWTGWTSADARRAEIDDVLRLLEKATAAPLENFVRGAMRERTVVALPPGLLVRSRDGVERDVAGSVAPVRDSRGESNGAVIAFGSPAATGSAEDSNHKPVSRPTLREPDSEMIFASEAMRDLMHFVDRIAASGVATILLEGESGVGKDVVARLLHQRSRRADQPFITVNCAAIPETLLESELFGYEKGAFTDARAQKKGVFDLADGGTVFLDEIGELQPHIQAKLLRVLEDQTFRRLGGVKDVAVDVRVITATNRDLAEAVHKHEFREDLYYRLNVIQVAIPPIRERQDDILPLAEFFVRRFNRRFNNSIRGVSPEAESLLLGHHWPGNVREIRNVIERAMVLEDSDRLQAENLAIGTGVFSAPASAPQPAAGASLAEVERGMLVTALERCGGNQTRAAKLLGISRDTLRYRVKKYGLK